MNPTTTGARFPWTGVLYSSVTAKMKPTSTAVPITWSRNGPNHERLRPPTGLVERRDDHGHHPVPHQDDDPGAEELGDEFPQRRLLPAPPPRPAHRTPPSE